MQNYFHEISRLAFNTLHGDETLLLNYEGEDSDFVRFNHNRIRQAGNVRQQKIHICLIAGKKQSNANILLCGDLQSDSEQVKNVLAKQREQFSFLPEDPYLNYSREVQNSERLAENTLPPAETAIDDIITTAQGLDLVGVWASGEMARGFANSLGQFNWQNNFNFNFDWSIYHHGDKAIKQNYAGLSWNRDFLQQKIAFARETSHVLEKEAKTIVPGKYRVFLAPSALSELTDLLSWGGFGLKSHRTSQTPLIKMIKEGVCLNDKITFLENHAEGMAPMFSKTGFIKPQSVSLIENGAYQSCLTDARSAKEYGAEVNASVEAPQSLEMSGGSLHQNDVLKTLDTGVYISNLWYCNYSDRNNCRITGMTRFACLWVENGKAVAPLNVMRFDETMYHLLGENLVDLTTEHEHILDTSTYEQRSVQSSRLPGALVKDFTFTL